MYLLDQAKILTKDLKGLVLYWVKISNQLELGRSCDKVKKLIYKKYNSFLVDLVFILFYLKLFLLFF
jgi:hypothetical protein